MWMNGWMDETAPSQGSNIPSKSMDEKIIIINQVILAFSPVKRLWILSKSTWIHTHTHTYIYRMIGVGYVSNRRYWARQIWRQRIVLQCFNVYVFCTRVYLFLTSARAPQSMFFFFSFSTTRNQNFAGGHVEIARTMLSAGSQWYRDVDSHSMRMQPPKLELSFLQSIRDGSWILPC